MNPHTAFLITVKQASAFLALGGTHTSGTEAEAICYLRQAGATVNALSAPDEPIHSSTRFLVTLEQGSYMLALAGSLATDIETVMLLGRVGAVEHSAPQQYEPSTPPQALSGCPSVNTHCSPVVATSLPPSIPSVRGKVDDLSHQLATACVISSTDPNPSQSARAQCYPRSRDHAPCSPVTSPASPPSVTNLPVTKPSGQDRAFAPPPSVTSKASLPSALSHQVTNTRSQVRAPIAHTAPPTPITSLASPPSAPRAQVADPVTQAPPSRVTCSVLSPSAHYPQAADPCS
jgi:hypothetical protein